MSEFIWKWRWRFLSWLNDHTDLCWVELVSMGNDGIIKNLWNVRFHDTGDCRDTLDHYKGCGLGPKGESCYCGKYQP